MGGEFCVVCGRTDVAVTDGVCASCFLAREPLVRAPEHATVVICPTCGARQVAAHWERSGASQALSAEDLTPLLVPHPEVAIRRVRWEETGGSEKQRELTGAVDVRFRGEERTAAVSLTVRIDAHSCPECSRRSGHYYTARIQLRGPSERIDRPSRQLREELERAWAPAVAEARSTWVKALSWKEELPEGWDFFLTDTEAARALARFVKERLGADLKESATLWSRKDGHDVYRVTIRLRIPLPKAPVRSHPRRGEPPGRAPEAPEGASRSPPPR